MLEAGFMSEVVRTAGQCLVTAAHPKELDRPQFLLAPFPDFVFIKELKHCRRVFLAETHGGLVCCIAFFLGHLVPSVAEHRLQLHKKRGDCVSWAPATADRVLPLRVNPCEVSENVQ